MILGDLMKSNALLFGCLVAACSSSPPTLPLQPTVPPVAGASRPAAAEEVRVRADADKSAPVRFDDVSAGAGDVTTGPVYRQVVHIVEKPVYIEAQPNPDVPVTGGDEQVGGRYDYRSGYYYGRGYLRPYVQWHAPRFPINTVIGAGIGAAIGHRGRGRERGAAIGAGVGLMIDLARWWR